MKKNILATYIFFGLSSIFSKESMAVGAVSRACQYNQIPSPIIVAASNFFIAVGAPEDYIKKIMEKNNYPDDKYWILESLTTNYLSTQYYLFASSEQFYSGVYNGARSSIYFRTVNSPGWGAQEISKEMRENSKWKKFYANRGPLFSQRAGYAGIVEDMSRFYKPYDFKFYFSVQGKHEYYDPVAKKNIRLKDTVAYDCNILNFGVEDAGLFDR